MAALDDLFSEWKHLENRELSVQPGVAEMQHFHFNIRFQLGLIINLSYELEHID